MKIPLQITFHQMQRSDALDDLIREKCAKLEQMDPHIMSCRVTISEEGKHKRQGHSFNVRLDIHVPRKEFAITRSHDEDVYIAVRDAFNAAKTRIEDEQKQRHGFVKQHDVPVHGKVARISFEEGIGFIETMDGREFYFSRENVAHPAFEALEPGTEVQFIEAIEGDGPKAKRVTAGKHHVP
jgi:ribosomal subunit interface protein